MKLTDGQKRALIDIGYGVRGSSDGHIYSEENPGRRLDLRSVDALHRRRLIDWHTRGGAPNILIIDLSEEGERIFEELRCQE